MLLIFNIFMVLTAGPAAAHAGLVDSNPASGASVQQAPEVRLRFAEPIDPRVVALVITGPDGREQSAGPPSVAGAEVVQPLVPGAGGGTYRVAYRVVSTDGHPVQGQMGFVVTASAPTVPVGVGASSQPVAVASAPAAAAGSDGPVSSPLAAAAALVVVTISFVVRRHRLRRSRGTGRD